MLKKEKVLREDYFRPRELWFDEDSGGGGQLKAEGLI